MIRKFFDWLGRTFGPDYGTCRGCRRPVAADQYECEDCRDWRQAA